MELSKDLRQCIVRIALLLAFSYKGLSQHSPPLKSSSSSSLHKSSSSSSSLFNLSSSWTILNNGFLSFNPILKTNQRLDFKLSFRTKSPHGLLFCHVISNTSQSEDKRYQFCAALHKGSINVTHQLGSFRDTFNIGKGMYLYL